MIELGIFAKTFAGRELDDALGAVEAAGITQIQFNMSLTGGVSLPDEISAGTADSVRAAADAHGLTMAAVSGTYNMAHPDPRQREDGAARLALLIAAAPALGTNVVTLCTGSRDPDDMWRAHPDNTRPDAWRDSLNQIARALEVAQEYGVILGFEPEHNNVVADAAAGRRLLEEMSTPHLRVVIDAANLIRPGELEGQRDTLKRAFDLLGDSLVLSHGKDLLADGSVVAAGQGGLDYELYLALLHEARYDGPLVLHGLAESDVPAASEYVLRHLEAGPQS